MGVCPLISAQNFCYALCKSHLAPSRKQKGSDLGREEKPCLKKWYYSWAKVWMSWIRRRGKELFQTRLTCKGPEVEKARRPQWQNTQGWVWRLASLVYPGWGNRSSHVISEDPLKGFKAVVEALKLSDRFTFKKKNHSGNTMCACKPVRSLAKIKWRWGQREMQDEDHRVWVKVMSFVLMLLTHHEVTGRYRDRKPIWLTWHARGTYLLWASDEQMRNNRNEPDNEP